MNVDSIHQFQKTILQTTEGKRARFGASRPTAKERPVRAVSILGLVVLSVVLVAQPFPSFLLDSNAVIGPMQDEPANIALCGGTDSIGAAVWIANAGLYGCILRHGRSSDSTTCIDIAGRDSISSVGQPIDVARGSGCFMVVWPDENMDTLWGGIVSMEGRLRGRFRIAEMDGFYLSAPSVRFDGESFLVAWDANSHVWSSRVCYARVTQDGRVLDQPPRNVRPVGGAQSWNSVAFGDSIYLAAYFSWSEPDSVTRLRCARIRTDGTVLDSAGIIVRSLPTGEAPTDNASGIVSVSFDGRSFILAWAEFTDTTSKVRVARVTTAGVVLDPEGMTAGYGVSSYDGVSMACVEDTSIVVWRSPSSESCCVRAARLDGRGNLLDTGVVIMTAPLGQNLRSICVTRSGLGFLVGWVRMAARYYMRNYRDVVGRRITASCVWVDSCEVVLSNAANYQYEVDVATDGENCFSVWTDMGLDSTGHDRFVRGIRFTRDGRVMDPASFAISRRDGMVPAVAYGAGCYLVTWLADAPGANNARVLAARVGTDGVLYDSVPIRLPMRDSSGALCTDVAYGDSTFLVVWFEYADESGVYGARIRPDGVVLDSVSFPLNVGSMWGFNNRVASDGSDFLVVQFDLLHHWIVGLRVSGGVVVDSAPIRIMRHGAEDVFAHVAYGSGVYMVAEPSEGKTFRVTPAGVVLDTPASPPFRMRNAQLAFDGTNFLLTAVRTATGTQRRVIRARRVTPENGFIDTVPLTLIDVDTEGTYIPEPSWSACVDTAGAVALVFPTFEPEPYVSSRVRASVFPAGIGGIVASPVGPVTRSAYACPTITRGIVLLSEKLGLEPGTSSALLDISGRKVADLKPGANDIRRLSPGIYFYRLDTPGYRDVRKMVLVK